MYLNNLETDSLSLFNKIRSKKPQKYEENNYEFK